MKNNYANTQISNQMNEETTHSTKKQRKEKKKKNLSTPTEKFNSPNAFQPFDYSQVDYSNYKGGSMTPKGQLGPKERFRKVKNESNFFY